MIPKSELDLTIQSHELENNSKVTFTEEEVNIINGEVSSELSTNEVNKVLEDNAGITDLKILFVDSDEEVTDFTSLEVKNNSLVFTCRGGSSYVASSAARNVFFACGYEILSANDDNDFKIKLT